MALSTDKIEEYKLSAELHGKYTSVGDSIKANKAYSQLAKNLRELVSAKTDRKLFSLYEEKNVSIQVWAAAHTLELDENRALQKLQEIVDKKIPHYSTDAYYTIKEWKLGNITFR